MVSEPRTDCILCIGCDGSARDSAAVSDYGRIPYWQSSAAVRRGENKVVPRSERSRP